MAKATKPEVKRNFIEKYWKRSDVSEKQKIFFVPEMRGERKGRDFGWKKKKFLRKKARGIYFGVGRRDFAKDERARLDELSSSYWKALSPP